MQVNGVNIVDDESFDQADFLRRVAESPECPKSSCPSPERYRQCFEGEAMRVYVVTPVSYTHLDVYKRQPER